MKIQTLKINIMKKSIFLFAALAVAAACTQVNISVSETEETYREVSIVASALNTKTQLQDDNTVRWESTDEIKLMFSPAAESEVDVRTSEFTFSETADEGVTAKFTGKIGNTVTTEGGYSDDVYAVYPSTAMADGGAVVWTVDATQSVAPGSFPTNKNLSSATISLDDLNANEVADANFQNALSIIRFTVPQYVNQVAVTGTSALTGERTMTFDADGVLVMSAVESTAQEKTITLTPVSGESFAFGDENVYNVLVYPGKHTSLTVNLTDTHGCTLSNTVAGSWNFLAGQYYNFNFKSEFVKAYSFTSTLEPAAGNKVLAVFPTANYTQELLYADAKYTGELKASMVHSDTDVTGYAVYPSTAYADGEITCDLDPAAGAPNLFTAALSVSALTGANPTVQFNAVDKALAVLNFTVPAGVTSVQISSTVPFAGKSTMTVSDGVLVAGAGDEGEFTVNVTAGETYNMPIYPISEATLTVTLTDGTGATVVKAFENVTVAAEGSKTLDLSGDLNFDKDGSFGNEGFEDGLGGGSIEF